eukprot:gene5048-8644_t
MVKEKTKKTKNSYEPYEKTENKNGSIINRFTSFLASFLPGYEEKDEKIINENSEEEKDIIEQEDIDSPIVKDSFTFETPQKENSKNEKKNLQQVTPIDVVRTFLRRKPNQREEDNQTNYGSAFKPHTKKVVQQNQKRRQFLSTPSNYNRTRETNLLTPKSTFRNYSSLETSSFSDLKRKREVDTTPSFIETSSKKKKKTFSKVQQVSSSTKPSENQFHFQTPTSGKKKSLEYSNTAKEILDRIDKLSTPLSDIHKLPSTPLSVRLSSYVSRRKKIQKKETEISSPPPPNQPIQLDISANFKKSDLATDINIFSTKEKKPYQRKKIEKEVSEPVMEEIFQQKEKELGSIPKLDSNTTFVFGEEEKTETPKSPTKPISSNFGLDFKETEKKEKDTAQILFGDEEEEESVSKSRKLSFDEEKETKKQKFDSFATKEPETLAGSFSFGESDKKEEKQVQKKISFGSFGTNEEEEKEDKTEEKPKSFGGFSFGEEKENEEKPSSFGSFSFGTIGTEEKETKDTNEKEEEEPKVSFSEKTEENETEETKPSFSGFSFDKTTEDKDKKIDSFSVGSFSVKSKTDDNKEEETKSFTGFSFGTENKDEEKKEEEETKEETKTSFGGFSFSTVDTTEKKQEEKEEEKKETQSSFGVFSFGSEEKKEEKEEKKETTEEESKPSFSGFSFGGSTTESEKKEEVKSFSFGSDDKTETTEVFKFGDKKEEEEKPSFGGFSSEEKKEEKKDESKPSFGFSFGAEEKKEEEKKETFSGFSFGGASTTESEKKESTPSFGSISTSFDFGGSSAAKEDDGVFKFGSSTTENKTDTAAAVTFGGTPSFGSTTEPTSTTSFGFQSEQPSSSTTGFGFQSEQPSSATSFGFQNETSSATGFGQTTTPSSFGGFGSSEQTTPSFGGFSQSSEQQQPNSVSNFGFQSQPQSNDTFKAGFGASFGGGNDFGGQNSFAFNQQPQHQQQPSFQAGFSPAGFGGAPTPSGDNPFNAQPQQQKAQPSHRKPMVRAKRRK